MTNLFRNTFRSDSARAQWWDYTRNGAYFITICTKNRMNYFGDVVDKKMILSDTGIIAEKCWIDIPNHHDFVELGEFVVMPNHVHGIIIINKPHNLESGQYFVGTGHALSLQGIDPSRQDNIDLSLQGIDPSRQDDEPGTKRFQNIGRNSISSIIGSYKSAVTKMANQLDLPNGWQTRFYDRIIRDLDEFERITEYIINNPEKWYFDNLYRNQG